MAEDTQSINVSTCKKFLREHNVRATRAADKEFRTKLNEHCRMLAKQCAENAIENGHKTISIDDVLNVFDELDY